MVDNLTAMYNRLSDVEDQLAASRRDILGPSPYLLSMHHQLNALEDFRNQTMHMAKSSRVSSDVRNTLKKHFQRLDNVIKEFEVYLVDIAGNMLEIVREGNGTAIVKLIKIAEIEGREDEKVRYREIFSPTIRRSYRVLGHWNQISQEGRKDRCCS